MSLNKNYYEELKLNLKNCNLFLPNSNSEAAALLGDLKINLPFYVIPNAVDKQFQHATPDTFVHQYGLKDFIICVGRIEPHKNQLKLLQALKDFGQPLVLVGKPSPHHAQYFIECQKYFNHNVLHIPHMDHYELGSAYKAARVNVLPSFSETTGLVSLEAGLAGINVVTTDRGYTREYFEDLVWYCNPSNENSIRNAVEQAWAMPFNSKLQDKILQKYTWEIAAEKTISAYKSVLEVKIT